MCSSDEAGPSLERAIVCGSAKFHKKRFRNVPKDVRVLRGNHISLRAIELLTYFYRNHVHIELKT